MKVNYIYIIIILLLYSCKNKDSEFVMLEKANDTINIPAIPLSKSLNYSDIFENIEYIPITTQDDFLIGDVDKLLVTEQCFFIVDQDISRSIFCVNKNGEKVLRINKIGTGPGEYISLRDVNYDSARNEIVIFCNIRRKLLYYNLKGNYLREESVPYNALRFNKTDSYTTFFFDYSVNNSVEKEGMYPNIISTSPDYSSIISTANYFNGISKQSLIWTSREQFSSWGDTLSVKPNHSNIVYYIIEGKIYPRYFLDFDKGNIDNRYWEKSMEKNITFIEFDNYCNSIGFCESYRYFENANFMCFIYKRNGERYYAFYSKKTKKTLHTNILINNIDFVTVFYPITIHDNKIYCLLNSDELFRSKEKLKGVLPDEILDNVQEFGNPVIVAFTVKPF